MFRNASKMSWMLAWVIVAGCTQFDDSRHPPIVPRPVAQPANQNQLRPGVNGQQQGGAVYPPIQPSPYNNSASNMNNRAPSPQPPASPFATSNQSFNPQAPQGVQPNNLAAPYTPGAVPGNVPYGPTSSNTGSQSQYSTPLSPLPGQR